MKKSVKTNVEKMFSLFSKDYLLKEGNIDNTIAMRRLQNSIQQFALYEESIKEILSDSNNEDELRIDTAGNLLKLIFEYLALADNIVQNGEAFINVGIPAVISQIRKTVESIEKNLVERAGTEPDNAISEARAVKTLLEDIYLLLNYWGR